MTNFIRIVWFHLKLYCKNQYFLWLTLSSTISITLLQYLFAYASNNLNDPEIWIRSGVFGLWSSATTATGVIGFQRFQGTLPYLFNTKVGNVKSFIGLIMPASLFGLLAFPIAYIVSFFLKLPVTNLTFSLSLKVILYWIGSLVLDLFIATFFVMTRNAIVYEQFITIPILLISGLFGYPHGFEFLYNYARWISPLCYPIVNLLYKKNDALGIFPYLCSIIIWLAITYILFKKVLNLTKKQGSLKII